MHTNLASCLRNDFVKDSASKSFFLWFQILWVWLCSSNSWKTWVTCNSGGVSVMNLFISFYFFVFSISSQESVAVGIIWVFHVSEALKLISWMEETRESFNKMLKQLTVAAQGFLVRICLSFPTINPWWDNIW